MKIASGAAPWRQVLKREWLLLLGLLLTLALAGFDPQPWPRYAHWLQLPTLAGLAGLLIATQGIRDSGMVQQAAAALIERARTLRSLSLRLVGTTALLSMLLTNDVSLLLIVPLTVAIGDRSNLPITRMVVLEALAVNAGSSLSPIGNPQNMLLWQHSGLSFLHFVAAMLAPCAVMAGLLLALTVCWLPAANLTRRGDIERPVVATRLGLLSSFALLSMVVALEFHQAAGTALLLLAVFALAARQTLARVDWLLLLTFAAIFLGLGHVAELTAVRQLLDRFEFGQPLTLYLVGIAASQLISNVPATVLLLDRTHDAMALAVAVNLGGFGLAIGSLANLIALRLAKRTDGLRTLHLVSIPFLLIGAPLVWLVWHGFG